MCFKCFYHILNGCRYAELVQYCNCLRGIIGVRYKTRCLRLSAKSGSSLYQESVLTKAKQPAFCPKGWFNHLDKICELIATKLVLSETSLEQCRYNLHLFNKLLIDNILGSLPISSRNSWSEMRLELHHFPCLLHKTSHGGDNSPSRNPSFCCGGGTLR